MHMDLPLDSSLPKFVEGGHAGDASEETRGDFLMPNEVHEPTWWDRFCHSLGWWCGLKLRPDAQVEIRCMVCCKEMITDEAWQRRLKKSS